MASLRPLRRARAERAPGVFERYTLQVDLSGDGHRRKQHRR